MAANRSVGLARAAHVVPVERPTAAPKTTSDDQLAEVILLDARRRRRDAARTELSARRSRERQHQVGRSDLSQQPIGPLPEPLAPVRWAVIGTVMLIAAALLSGQA